MMWNSPQYHPERYELTYLCIANSTCCPETCHEPILVNSRILNLNSDSTSFRLFDIRAFSVCVLRLVAIFNPASIDSGIVFTAKMIAANTSKLKSRLGFHINYAFNSVVLLA